MIPVTKAQVYDTCMDTSPEVCCNGLFLHLDTSPNIAPGHQPRSVLQRTLFASGHQPKYGRKATRQCVRMVRNFRQCDNEGLLMDLEQAPWNILDTFDSMDEKWDCWKSLFLSIVDGHAPLRKVRVKADTYPWMTDEVRCLARARNYYRKKFMQTKNQSDWECFKNL